MSSLAVAENLDMDAGQVYVNKSRMMSLIKEEAEKLLRETA